MCPASDRPSECVTWYVTQTDCPGVIGQVPSVSVTGTPGITRSGARGASDVRCQRSIWIVPCHQSNTAANGGPFLLYYLGHMIESLWQAQIYCKTVVGELREQCQRVEQLLDMKDAAPEEGCVDALRNQ